MKAILWCGLFAILLGILRLYGVQSLWLAIIALLIGFVLIGLIFKLRAEQRLLVQIGRHLRNAPAFDPSLVDCYVKFSGKVISPNQFNSPFLNQTCAFFETKIFAHWQAKAKKPKKGLEAQTKQLYAQQSQADLLELISPQGQVVCIQPSMFSKTMNLSEPLILQTCPRLCAEQVQPKYKTYSVLEKVCTENQRLDIYAKLTQAADGTLYLSPTRLAAWRTLVLDGSDSGRIMENILQDIQRKANWKRRWRIALTVMAAVASLELVRRLALLLAAGI